MVILVLVIVVIISVKESKDYDDQKNIQITVIVPAIDVPGTTVTTYKSDDHYKIII